MKIAILTLPLHTNYGGNIQAFALQLVLKNMGHDPIAINYRKGGGQRSVIRRILSKIKRTLVSNKSQTGYIFNAKEKVVIDKYHNDFIDGYINCSSPLYNDQQLNEFVTQGGFDAVIVGSDQVWRPKYTPNIEPFFFGFLRNNNNVKKIAYAASFGSDVWEYTPEQVKSCGALIKDFSYVSVRESLGAVMCQEYFNVTAEHVLDPTLLLDRKNYIDIFSKMVLPDNTGKIFNYILDSSGDKAGLMQRVSDILGKEVFSTYPKKSVKDSHSISDISEYQFPPIEAWLKSFHDADFVITDSFHGTVFSIIFNKPFIAICNQARGAARFHSLLKMFGLDERLVSDFRDINADVIKSPIDFDKVNGLLNISRAHSLDFIKKALDR